MWWLAAAGATVGGMLIEQWLGKDAPEQVTYNVTLISGSAALIILGGIVAWQMLRK